jgi:hypothetical protein
LQDPLKFTKIGIFGLNLATLIGMLLPPNESELCNQQFHSKWSEQIFENKATVARNLLNENLSKLVLQILFDLNRSSCPGPNRTIVSYIPSAL